MKYCEEQNPIQRDCNSDHNLMVVTMELQLQNKSIKKKIKKRLQYKELKNDDIQNNFTESALRRIGTSTPRYELLNAANKQTKKHA